MTSQSLRPRPVSGLVLAFALCGLAAAASAAPGVWTLTAVKANTTLFDTTPLYGNKVNVTFVLEYKAGSGALTASPMLDWHEKFIKLEHKGKERWVHESNMYAQNPGSATLMVWPRRYIEAYNGATGETSSSATMKGKALLFGKKGKVTGKELGQASSDAEKAAAVKKWLAKNGGRLEVTIEDIPSLNRPAKGEKNERLLLFNVGVVNVQAPRAKIEQYLEVDGDHLATTWTRTSTQKWIKNDLPLPIGFKDVTAPTGVTNLRVFQGGSGEEL